MGVIASMKLNELKVLGADNKTMIKVYDGDVYYLDSEKWVNFTYYSDTNKKRKKTRPYSQWSAMTNRSNVGGKHQEVFSTYSGTVRSELFCNFDSWCNWAENVGGYMCEDSNGMLWELDIASDIMSNRNFESISESYPELVEKMLVKIDLIKHNLFMLESGIF